MRSVFGIVRINVFIFVRVIVNERYFIVYVYVVNLQIFGITYRLSFSENARDIVLFEHQGFFGKSFQRFGEHGVANVETGVENGNRSAFARKGNVARIVNTRVVYFYGVSYGRSVRRHGFGLIVRVRKAYGNYSVATFHIVEFTVRRFYRNGVDERGILIHDVRYKSARFKSFYNGVLFFFYIVKFRLTAERRHILRHARVVIYTIVYNRATVYRQNGNYFVAVLISVVFK